MYTITLALTLATAAWAPIQTGQPSAVRPAPLRMDAAPAPVPAVAPRPAGEAKRGPVAPWALGDPADSLYRAARAALNDSDYRRASDLFRQIRERYPKSAYAADSYYWEAFALYRLGDTESLRQAREALQLQRDRFPKAATAGDARTLATRIEGQLARRGDPVAAENVTIAAAAVAPEPPQPSVPAVAPMPAPAPTPRVPGMSAGDCDDNDDARLEALNALLQMDSERAVPILKKVLARRDAGSVCLRRKAVFLVSQKRGEDTETLLLDVVRNDPDPEVREQAVFWLGQSGGDRAVAALDSILRTSKDPGIQEKAVFAIAQNRSARAGQILRGYAEREDVPSDARANAIFWLGQQRSADNAAFLRGLFKKTRNREVKEKVIFALAQTHDPANGRWLLDLAVDPAEDVELRKNALFWAGQGKADLGELTALYDRMKDREMREQLIFVYSQRRDPAALDKLIQIAKTEKDPELRKRAVFWIGQSRDPKAAAYLMEVIEKDS